MFYNQSTVISKSQNKYKRKKNFLILFIDKLIPF